MNSENSDQRYVLVTEDEHEKFVQLVNQYVDQGYEPLGGVQVATHFWTDNDGDQGSTLIYNQALFR